MSEQRWLVIRCPQCQQCFGHRSLTGRCPHCGQSLPRDSEVLCEVTSAPQLHIEVALANTPEGLRASLREKLEKANRSFEGTEEFSPRALMAYLRKKADENGVIDRMSVLLALQQHHSDISVDDLMERAESEGFALRLDDGHWQFFE